MEKLNVCETWVSCVDKCYGNCGRRRPRWQGSKDLFYYNICHKNIRGTCARRPFACRRLHADPDWEGQLSHTMGQKDAAWDWTAGDVLTDLFRSSSSVNPERILDGVLQLVSGDPKLAAYFEEVRDRVR